MEPHPGITHLLNRLDVEDAGGVGAEGGLLAEAGARQSHA